jgi:hypothetical protein
MPNDEATVHYLDPLNLSLPIWTYWPELLKDHQNPLRQAFESEEGLLPRDWMRADAFEAEVAVMLAEIRSVGCPEYSPLDSMVSTRIILALRYPHRQPNRQAATTPKDDELQKPPTSL